MQQTTPLDVLREMIRADESFYRNVMRLSGGNPVNLMTRYMNQRALMLEYLNSIMPPPQPQVQMTFQVPANWGDAVPIVATAAERAHAILPLANSNPPPTCAICQEDITEDGCELRNCHHRYHRECIDYWFTSSVRCPVCRNDIRETED